MKKIIFLLFNFCFNAHLQAQISSLAPPNEGSKGRLHNGDFSIWYAGKRILAAKADNSLISLIVTENKVDDKVEQVMILESKSNHEFTLNGTITGSDEAFSCEADYPRNGLPIVRHVVGLSNNSLNKAIYDRAQDWVLSFDLPGNALIKPIIPSFPSQNNIFQFTVSARRLSIRFRPRYYQKHKMLKYYEPWKYKVWNKSVTGWCSWYAFGSSVNEGNIKTIADTLSKVLLPFGYNYLQIDDGYQQEPIGLPSHWLVANNKFPGGLNKLCDYIKTKGLTAGIWTNVSFADSPYVYSHRQFFVSNSEGKPAKGDWIGYVMDGSHPGTIQEIVNPVYAGLHKMGWNYFKVDALRHLKYEGYNTYRSYFDIKKFNRENAFRHILDAIRRTVGRESYILGCWGIRPELIGLIDGCRIGNDGFSYAGLAQYNSFNNVVWRNDPDHVELTDQEAFRSCTVTSLTGSVLMLTDKPDHYQGRILEAAKRAAPVLFTLPGQIYEVDPSRIQALQKTLTEVSGDGPRVFDASYTPITEFYSLEVNKFFESWLVLGRLNDKTKEIPLNDLGLSKENEYYVFEFWTQHFLGAVKKMFYPPPIDSFYNCQVFCFRKKENHPQLLATNRHISCGALELVNCNWHENMLSGKSELIPNDEYQLFLHVPRNFKMVKVNTDVDLTGTSMSGDLLTVTMKSTKSKVATWTILFESD